MSKIVGIDLGSTNSLVEVLAGVKPVVITMAAGSRLLPSVVTFIKTGEQSQPAGHQALVSMENRVEIPMTSQSNPSQKISAVILKKLKQDAEAYLGEPVTQAVITVPAYFNASQRQATKDAGKNAGLEVLRIIKEPIASALAYGLGKKKDEPILRFDLDALVIIRPGIPVEKKKQDETILVFDLGSGTFDVSVLDVGEGVVEVKATTGDTHLGGDDWDAVLAGYLADEFMKKHRIDLRIDRRAFQRLAEAAEKAKIELSSMLETEVNLPDITAGASGPLHLQIKITRNRFEQLCTPLVQRCRGPIGAALRNAGRKPQDLDELVLVGGATRMPMIQQLARELAGSAAIRANILEGEIKDVDKTILQGLEKSNENLRYSF